MYHLDFEYSDAKMRRHELHLKCDKLEDSQAAWETMVIVLNDMKRNGTLTHYAGFMDCSRRETR